MVTLKTSILDAFIEMRHLLAVLFDSMEVYDTAWWQGIINPYGVWAVSFLLLLRFNE